MFLLVLLRTAHVLRSCCSWYCQWTCWCCLQQMQSVIAVATWFIVSVWGLQIKKKKKKKKKLIWNKVDCWCSETRLKHTKDWKELWILIRQKCAHAFLFVCCCCCCFLVNSEFWSDNTKRVHIFKVKPFSSRPVNKWIAFRSVHYLCVICLSVAWGLPTEFAHLLYCPIKIVILFQPFCVGVFQ